MTILSTLIWNLLAPAAISASAVALARWLSRQGWPGRWGVATGLGLGYLAGHWGILGWPSTPSWNVDTPIVVFWMTLVASLLGILEAWKTPSPTMTWTIRAVFVALVLGWLLRSKVLHSWSILESASWLIGLGLAILASWWNLESQAERIPGPGWMFHLGLVAAGWAAVQVLSGSASLGQLDGVLASTALGGLPTVGLRPGPGLSRGGPAVALAILAGLGLTGYVYSEVPAVSGLLLALAPWTPWVDRVGWVRRRTPWTRASVRVLVVLLTVGAAVLVAEAASSAPIEGETL